MSRLVPTAVAIFLLVPGSALAQKTERTTETSPVTFELTSAACPNLPAGTTIKGQGTLTSVTWTTKRRGVTTVTNSSIAPGTATDQAGNQYTFLYSNQILVSNASKRKKQVYSGTMIDLFDLKGTGPATLSNGFLAKFKTDFSGHDSLRPIDSFGDPIDFKAIQPHCDPL
jgi:hypothetical protein